MGKKHLKSVAFRMNEYEIIFKSITAFDDFHTLISNANPYR